MILYQGSLFDNLEAACLVNPTNAKGVDGGGLALEFRRRFPANSTDYRRSPPRAGSVFMTSDNLVPGRDQIVWIANFSTKDDWRNPSRLEWIDSGLIDLKQQLLAKHIPSVAIPALGCGLGELPWGNVLALIRMHFDDDLIRTLVYEPK